MISVLGAINHDTTLFVSSLGRSGEEIPIDEVQEFPGGKGANFAAAAAKIYGRGNVAFLGATGDDSVGRFLCRNLASDGVNVEGIVRLKGKPTGRAFIVVDVEGRKIIHTRFGANDLFLPAHLDSFSARTAISSSAAVVVMDPPTRVMKKAVRLAKIAGARIVLSPGVRAFERERVLELLPPADDLVVDRSELARLALADEPANAIAKLSQDFPRLNVIATLGPEGSLVYSGGTSWMVDPIDLSKLGLKAVNSTGSGDAFLAAYVCYSLFGANPWEAAAWGNLAGALKATSLKTRGSPSKRTLEASMGELNLFRGPRLGSPSSKV